MQLRANFLITGILNRWNRIKKLCLQILFVLLFSATYAQQQEETAPAQERPARAPQGHIQYSDPDGNVQESSLPLTIYQ